MTTDAEAPEPTPEPDPVAKLFTDLFPSAVLQAGKNGGGETELRVSPSQAAFVVRQAKERPDLGFNHLRCLTGIDQMERGIEIVYSLFSYPHRHAVHIKTLLPPDDPTVDSITPFWLGADWHERETAEMFGVTFRGHPNPKHLLLDDDMTIHPLLKAHPLAPIEMKQGVETF
ncbi:MAG TPA: NADH-quinone oxidoreductase subunit C [Dehalococcoidia bacterium]|jgi:NADH-quinone oxidoreductase subunit C